jgi:hydroxyacylglutathione hydrolase
LVLIADSLADRTEAVRQLVRIGYDDLRGYLDGGIAAWQAAGLAVEQVPVTRRGVCWTKWSVAAQLRSCWTCVRTPSGAGHLPAPTASRPRSRYCSAGSPKEEPIVVYCGHGERSTVALSLLARQAIALTLLEAVVRLAGGRLSCRP